MYILLISFNTMPFIIQSEYMSIILLSQEEITLSNGDFREMQGRTEGLTEELTQGLLIFL